jgi:hypothetical protein
MPELPPRHPKAQASSEAPRPDPRHQPRNTDIPLGDKFSSPTSPTNTGNEKPGSHRRSKPRVARTPQVKTRGTPLLRHHPLMTTHVGYPTSPSLAKPCYRPPAQGVSQGMNPGSPAAPHRGFEPRTSLSCTGMPILTSGADAQTLRRTEVGPIPLPSKEEKNGLSEGKWIGDLPVSNDPSEGRNCSEVLRTPTLTGTTSWKQRYPVPCHSSPFSPRDRRPSVWPTARPLDGNENCPDRATPPQVVSASFNEATSNGRQN